MTDLKISPDLDDGFSSLVIDEIVVESSEALATKCEGLQSDNERRQFFRSIDHHSSQTLELNCPAILVLAKDAKTDEFRDELREFLIKNLSNEKSRLVRKTCGYILKTYFLTAENSRVQEFFILLSSLEEAQFHVVEPSLEKLTILSTQILKNDCPLKWEHLRVGFIIALRHVNGWVRASTILRIFELPFQLLEEDYEFLMNNFFESLIQFYDFYWRVDQFCGRDAFIDKLRLFIEQFQTREFYVKFLNHFIRQYAPCPMFFISCSLPISLKKLFNEQDFPLARHLLMVINKIQFQKLRHNIFLNFFAFLVRIFDLKSAQDFIPFFELLPENVKPLANQILLETFSESIEYNEISTTISLKSIDELELIEKIFNGEDLSNDCIKSLVEAIPKANDERKEEIVKAMERLFIESRKTQNALTICMFYVNSLVATFDLNPNEKLKRLFKILGAGLRTPQIAFIISREISKQANISTELYPLLLDLSIYGESQIKADEVINMAHKRAQSFDLDEITDVHLLRRRTRELAITKLLVSCLQNKDLIGKFVLQILQKYDETDKVSKGRNYGLSPWHLKQTRLILLLLIFIGNTELSNNLSESDHTEVRNFCTQIILEPNHQYSIKLTVEWILTLYCIRDQAFYDFFLEQSPNFALKRIGAVTSWIIICLRSLRVDNEVTRQRLIGFLIKILPWVTTQHFLVRVFSLAAVKFICNWHRKFIDETSSFKFAIEVADFNIDVSGNSRKLVDSICADPFFERIFPGNIDLTLIFYVLPRLSGLSEDELLFEQLPKEPLLKKCGLLNFSGKISDFDASAIFHGVGNNNISKPKVFDEEKPLGENGDFQIQQKLDTLEMNFAGKKKNLNERKQLIVIASLVKKIPNIAGLCRTCEVFNVNELIVSNSKIIDTKEFQAQSVSADLHLKITEVRVDNLIDYLKECREKGFSIIALEQASRSVKLEKFKFPEKTILLLGEEKFGIAAELMRYCDHLVEISQLGVTRSLNVHVAGSLVIYNYAIQHLINC